MNYWIIVLIPFCIAISPALTNIFLALMVVLFLLKRIINKEPFYIVTPINIPFLLFILAAFLSFKNSLNYADSLHGILKLLKYAAIFLICSVEIRDKRHLTRIIAAITLGASLVTIDALWQIAFGRDFIRGNVLQSAIGLIRPTASFPNPNVMGVYLSATTPLIVGLALFYYKGKTKMTMLLAGILAATGLYLTFSRGSGLGLYLALLFMAVARRNRTLTAVLIIMLMAFPLLVPKNIKDWARQVNYNPVVFMCNYDRLSMYRNTINMIRHHPFLGVGVNTFIKNYGKYKLPEPENAKTPDSIYAHNSFLQMTAEVGLLGLVAFLWALFALFSYTKGAYKKIKDSYYRIVLLSVVACLFAFLVNSLTETSLYYARVVTIFWYLVGFLLAFKKFLPSDAS